MTEGKAWRELQSGSEEALCWFIDQYTPYVSTIIYNIIGAYMNTADIEEVASDVFLAFWQNRSKVHAGSIRGYLSSIARNMAKNKLRQLGRNIPLEEDLLITDSDTPESKLEKKELTTLLQRAVLSMHEPDREIFLRFYYYYQSVEQISQDLSLNPSTVKTKLHRGRLKLKAVLTQYLT